MECVFGVSGFPVGWRTETFFDVVWIYISGAVPGTLNWLPMEGARGTLGTQISWDPLLLCTGTAWHCRLPSSSPGRAETCELCCRNAAVDSCVQSIMFLPRMLQAQQGLASPWRNCPDSLTSDQRGRRQQLPHSRQRLTKQCGRGSGQDPGRQLDRQ